MAAVLGAIGTMLLTACGGGADTTSSPVAPPVAASLALAGNVSTGQMLAGAAVTAKCDGGNGTATTAADGSYAITIAGGKLPCVLSANASGGATVLHSVAVGSASSARVNITSISELVVARVSASRAATYFDAFGLADMAALTPSAVTAALGAVAEALAAGGIDLSAAGDVLGGPLVDGNPQDRSLDMLGTSLATSGTTLPELGDALALAGPKAAVSGRSSVASLPPELLLAPAAPNCKSLRSGKYRVVVNQLNPVRTSDLVSVDAQALKIRSSTGNVSSLTPSGDCFFVLSGGGELVVSRAGVISGRVGGDVSDGALHAAVFIPEQSHAVDELAGDWNFLGYDHMEDTDPIHVTSGTMSFSTAGKLSALTYCDDVRTCVTAAPASLSDVVLSRNSGGGFDSTNATERYVDRVFAYRAGGGELMVVSAAAAGHVTLFTRKHVAVLPPLGRVQEFWRFVITPAYTVPAALNMEKNGITSLDAASSRYVRSAVINLATGTTRPETLQVNSFRDGYLRRLPASVSSSDGTQSTVAEFESLPLLGMDMSVVATLVSNQLSVSVVSSTVIP